MSIAYVETLNAYMRAHANSEQAISMKKYMRDQFEFLGLPTSASY